MKKWDQYASLKSEYAAIAGEYDRRWKHYVASSIEQTLAGLEVSAGARLLDVGCGTGVMFKRLAAMQPVAEYIGTDLSMEMLGNARERVSADTSLIRAGAENLPFVDRSFDIVVSSSVFHYIRQPDRALCEIHRVLRPGGRLVITDWCRDFLTCRLMDLYLRLTSPAHFRMYESSEFTELLAEHGFGHLRTRTYKIDWLWGLMTTTAIKSR